MQEDNFPQVVPIPNGQIINQQYAGTLSLKAQSELSDQELRCFIRSSPLNRWRESVLGGRAVGSSLFFKQGFLDSQKLFLPLVIWACSCVASNSLCQAYPIVSPISFRFRARSLFILCNFISSITTGCYCLLATNPISRNDFPFLD